MNAPRNSTWWRHDANMTTDLRFTKLRGLLKSDPYGLICRLYDLAASMQQDGDMTQIDPDVLALRLEFYGPGKRLRKILTDADYLDADGVIVGWKENLFRLYTSIRDQNRERGLKSAAKRAQVREKDITEHNTTTTVERPVQRPVESDDVWASLPPELATDDFKRAWESYQAYRRESRFKPLKPPSIIAQWATLAGWGHAAAIESINASIRQGWQGLFPPKSDPAPTQRPEPKLKTAPVCPGDDVVIGRVS